MDKKGTPFTDEYVKDQRSSLLLGYRLFTAIGALVTLIAIVSLLRDPGFSTLASMPVALIFLLWAALAKTRLNTFHENLELSKMIQQLREDK